jgi:hypothetical protein
MANERLRFERDLADLRRRVDSHACAQHFSGTGVVIDGHQLADTVQLDDGDFELSAKLFAHLFLVLNDSRCEARFEDDESVDGAPPGLYVTSYHDWMVDGQYFRVGLYDREGEDESAVSKGVFIDHVFIDEHKAPRQLGTVGFVYLALAAHELGRDEITLLAGGGAARNALDWNPPTMVGYKVWPKFGFDAPLERGEMARVKHLSHCKTVSDVRRTDLDWWENVGGNGRIMRFDLHPASDSWQTLLNYVQSKDEFK